MFFNKNMKNKHSRAKYAEEQINSMTHMTRFSLIIVNIFLKPRISLEVSQHVSNKVFKICLGLAMSRVVSSLTKPKHYQCKKCRHDAEYCKG